MIMKTEAVVGLTMIYIGYAIYFLVLCVAAFLYVDGVYSTASELFGRYNHSIKVSERFERCTKECNTRNDKITR